VRILVIGATSAIAQATARLWAARGESIYLAARREPLLSACTDDLRVRGAKQVAFEVFDVTDRAAHQPMMDRAAAALGGLDCVLLAHGTLPDQAACEASVDAALREIEVNGVATAALAMHAARRFENQGSGTIAVITSVAGVRGRESNFVYGAAKAMASALLGGLRQKLHHKKGIAVIDIRPGFVDTPMTAALKKGGPLWATPDKVARDIVGAIDRRAMVVYTPWFWRWIMLIIRHIPEFVFVRIKL
jgi:decaprenylphospho-beta-D-erythro-pentofuranosid-2-ulose 2-reductase